VTREGKPQQPADTPAAAQPRERACRATAGQQIAVSKKKGTYAELCL